MKYEKYAGIAAIVLEYTSISLFMLFTHQTLSLHNPISYYSTLDSTTYLFSATFSIAALLFAWWGTWIAKERNLHKYFKITLFIALFAQILMSWLPDKGSYQQLHSITAVIIGFCMPALIYFYNQANTHKKTKLLFSLFVITEILMLFFYPISLSLGFALITELIAGISFHIWVILVTFEKKLLQFGKPTKKAPLGA